MQKAVFTILREHSDDIFKVNSIIISAYIRINKLSNILNREIKRHLIDEASADNEILNYFITCLPDNRFGFEELIELFEFVISPSDKIVNGAVYTPLYIREYIVAKAFERILVSPYEVKMADISCGCGGFLLTTVAKIKASTNKDFASIFKENIFGVDIASYSVERAKLLLTLYAIVNGQDKTAFTFNLFTGNSLTFNWSLNSPVIQANGGFDLILGNPPYVASRNMDEQTLKLMANIGVAGTGHPDLYIPFFQIGFELLTQAGVLGYITVNTFIKSINGRALRQYFHDKRIVLDLINFGGEQVFQDRNTYTCICFLSHGDGIIRYRRTNSRNIYKLKTKDFIEYYYEALNHIDGWNLTNALIINRYIETIEGVGKPFKMQFTTKNGIATLKNDVYKFKPYQEDSDFYYIKLGANIFPIEKGICRDIVNANKLKTPKDLIDKLEKIIFPYNVVDGNVEIIPEETLLVNFPMTYKYLSNFKGVLATRDKGNRDYEVWYAYGRRQSMDINKFKLFFPHICDKPTFVISQNRDLLFYNGIAVVSDTIEELVLLKKLMETRLFYTYLRATTKDYSSGYISMSRNYLKNFGIYQFSKKEKIEFLSSDDPEGYIVRKYLVEIPDLHFDYE